MLVAVGTVHMAVRDFFFGSAAHIDHLASEAQFLPGQGVVAIQMHLRALDFHHRKRAGMALLVLPLELPADFHAGWKLGFGDGLL